MTTPHLSRRLLLGLMPLFAASRAVAAAKPHDVRFFSGGFDGARHLGGLHVRMSPGWKTYWRVPGAGGIPPEMTASGNNIADFAFTCPLPARMMGGDGESIGYKDEVVFPWVLTPVDPAKPVAAALSAFIGVCETVCIPVAVQEAMTLAPLAMATRDSALLAQWQPRTPVMGDAVTGLTTDAEDGKVFVKVTLKSAARDVFIEGSPAHYFKAPLWGDSGLTARCIVRGAKSPDELRGQTLRITLDVNGGGLEQTLTVR